MDEAEVERGNADAIVAVVAHKRKGKGKALDQYVTMSVRDFIYLLGVKCDRAEHEGAGGHVQA